MVNWTDTRSKLNKVHETIFYTNNHLADSLYSIETLTKELPDIILDLNDLVQQLKQIRKEL